MGVSFRSSFSVTTGHRLPAAASALRLLAIDYGERRIGLAVSDPTGLIASPAGFIQRRAGKRPPIAEIVRRAEALEAEGFVVGLPLDDTGEETERTVEVRRIAAELEKRTGLTARLVDERYTTAAALRAVREMGGSTRDRKGDIDALAATLLLQHALALK
jgi:putative Holliday junction resolvase